MTESPPQDSVQYVPILIAGSSSAGLACAAQASRYNIPFLILEKNPGPLEIGQADGVQCRTVEILGYLGKGPEILKEGCWIKEVAFWKDGGAPADEEGGEEGDGESREVGREGEDEGRIGKRGGRRLKRVSVSPDTAPGTSHMPHVILNQARINGLLAEAIQESRKGTEHEKTDFVEYGCEVLDVQIDRNLVDGPEAYPVTVKALKNGQERIYKAQYVFGADGAHSKVRKALGIQMLGDTTNRVWGVVDTYPRTSFPDIRKKCFLSSQAGSIVVIPREGGSLVRFYIELPPETHAKDVSLEGLERVAKEVFSPYEMDFTDVFWWSAYSIGQRQAERFDMERRIFLAGDAAHTHSPKAGQGMNVSLQDGWGFGWKVGMVVSGLASPRLMETYVLEREKVATDLIEFDRYWSTLVSKKHQGRESELELSEGFDKSRAYTAGITAQYEDSVITSAATSKHELAKKVVVGLRLPSTPLTRMADAKPMHLSEGMPADSRWRILVFGGDISQSALADKLNRLGEYLKSPKSPISLFTPPSSDIDSVIETLVLLSGKRHAADYTDIHPYFWPTTGKHRLRNLYKIFYDDEAYWEYGTMQMHAYEFYGVDPAVGAIVIVRPDQHVSKIVGLEDHIEISDFFGGFMLRPANAALGKTELRS